MDYLSFDKTKSIESISSQYQVETGRFTENYETDKFQDNVNLFGECLFDAVSLVLNCTKHRAIALAPVSVNKGLWFPTNIIKSGQSYGEALQVLLKQLLMPMVSGGNNLVKPPQMVHLMRLQIPHLFEFVSRVLYYTEFIADDKSCGGGGGSGDCCNVNSLITWYPYTQLNTVNNLWGPEPMVWANLLSSGNSLPSITCNEVTVKELATYINSTGVNQDMLKACGCNEREIILLYSEFIQHCYPSQYMNFFVFCDYLTKTNLILGNKDDLPYIFRAFTFNFGMPCINFYEFICGLAAIDKQTVHGGYIGEVRVGYIFRYYNKSSNLLLDYTDLRWFARDLMQLKGITYSEENHEREIAQMYAAFNLPVKTSVSNKIFLRTIGSLHIRGTSLLFRSPMSPLSVLKSKPLYPDIQLHQVSASKMRQNGSNMKMQYAKGSCMRCKEKQYTLAAHQVKVLQDGTIVEPQEIKLKGDVQRISKAARRLSDLAFYANNLCNVLTDTIRNYFENPESAQWTLAKVRFAMVDKILQLCSQAEELFATETRIVKVCSPVFVFGDIHGNLHDLMLYERIFWRMGPACLSNGYLFLGDYVDRGIHSVECIIYLLCAKLLAPNRFTLLRGNHELRAVQQQFTFYRECIDKFEKHGLTVWECFNKVFDAMPLCAIIDEQIFCAHGGIPTSVTKIDNLMLTIPCPMRDPEKESAPAWEVLWNDPINNRELDQCLNQLKSQQNTPFHLPAGFLPNMKRGTAYYFGDEAVNAFCAANYLSHVIRAHEVMPSGFQLHCGGRVITVFSSSKYCGGLNDAATILVEDNKIRIIKIDTS